MNRYKRILTALLAFAMLVSLSGCEFLDSLALPEQSPAPAAQSISGTQSAAPAEVNVQPAAQSRATPEPTAEPVLTDTFITVGINEIMASNKAYAPGPDGSYPDWIELYNYGGETVDLSAYLLCCGDAEASLEGCSIAPGEYLVFWCTKQPIENAVAISLSKSGCRVSLKGIHGTVIESIECPKAEADTSIYRNDDGSVVSTSFPSPGFENSAAGYAAYQQTLSVSSPLIISEAMAYNNRFLPVGNSYYDWVELKNVSSGDVFLGEYSVYDKDNSSLAYPLPEKTLSAGECFIVYCSGEEELYVNNGANAGFALSADSDRVFLFKNGELADALSIHDVPYCGSIGRLDGQNGTFFFAEPTPAESNRSGCRDYAQTPVLTGSDGIFNGVDTVTVTLSAPGTIYYTLNGGTPSASSTLYTGPFELSKTTPVRAIAYEDGKLPSRELDLSFIINENHTLPVVSIMADYNDFTATYYNPNIDRTCMSVINFYGNEGRFSMPCDIKLHGETSKFAQDKRSMKVSFRSRYGGELEYDIFGNGITEYASILLRAAQESSYSTQIRDNLMHQIAIESFPALPAQDGRYCILYINGEYWGLYNIREAFSAKYYEEHYGTDEDNVVHWKGKWDAYSGAEELYQFIMNRDLSDPDNYAYVCEHLNIDSVIGWAILQAYSGNFDLNPSNMRFFYDTEKDYLTYVLVDLDLGFFSYDMFDLVFNSDYAYNRLVFRLLKSPEFRQRMTDTLAEVLTTTLANDNVLALVDEMTSTIAPEIERDRQRWGGTYDNWLNGGDMVRGVINFINNNIGRAGLLVNSWKNKINMPANEVEQYFSEVVRH